jgi:hypothetical protein
MKRFFNFETLTGLMVSLVVLSALTGLAGNALKALGMDAENIGLADALTGLATLVVAALSWIAARRQVSKLEAEAARSRRPIKVFLTREGEKRELPLFFRAIEVTRAEMLGRMGMMPMKDAGKRFTFGFFSQPDFLRGLNEIQDGDGDELLIPVSEIEMSQFDWDKMYS